MEYDLLISGMVDSIYHFFTSEELILSGIRGGVAGFVAGVFAILIYRRQHKKERHNNKQDNVDILLDEVNRISGITQAYDRSAIRKKTISPPGNKIYSGMLLTGNIKYFNVSLREKLATFYDNFELNSLEPDQDLCREILEDLEKIKENNLAWYLFPFRHIIYMRRAHTEN